MGRGPRTPGVRTTTLLVFLSSLPLVACGDDSSDDAGAGSASSSGSGSSPTTDAGEAPDPDSGPGSSGPDSGSTSSDPGSTGTPQDTTAGDTTGDGTTGAVEEPPPTNAAELLPWLEAGEYLEWAAESGVHPSAGPHGGGVRTFVNAALLGSLEAGLPAHPQDAAAVKELYTAGGQANGWAVMVKVQADSAGGEGWYWYELYGAEVFADGTGVGLCSGCHSGGGVDYVLSPFPLQ